MGNSLNILRARARRALPSCRTFSPIDVRLVQDFERRLFGGDFMSQTCHVPPQGHQCQNAVYAYLKVERKCKILTKHGISNNISRFKTVIKT